MQEEASTNKEERLSCSDIDLDVSESSLEVTDKTGGYRSCMPKQYKV